MVKSKSYLEAAQLHRQPMSLPCSTYLLFFRVLSPILPGITIVISPGKIFKLNVTTAKSMVKSKSYLEAAQLHRQPMSLPCSTYLLFFRVLSPILLGITIVISLMFPQHQSLGIIHNLICVL